jgi:hypothetical protein
MEEAGADRRWHCGRIVLDLVKVVMRPMLDQTGRTSEPPQPLGRFTRSEVRIA